MAKKKNNWGGKFIFFLLGMAVMFCLDLFFHFNNSVETQINRELNKAGQKIEKAFKNQE